MAYRVFGEELFTSHFSGSPVFYQKVIMPDYHAVLDGVKTSVIVYNNPSFTSLEMRLYSMKNNSLRQLIATSEVKTKAEIITESNGIRNVPFVFSTRRTLYANDYYGFVLWANGYTGDGSSHIAWMKDFPDPVNPEGLTVSYDYLIKFPYRLALIGERR